MFRLHLRVAKTKAFDLNCNDFKMTIHALSHHNASCTLLYLYCNISYKHIRNRVDNAIL